MPLASGVKRPVASWWRSSPGGVGSWWRLVSWWGLVGWWRLVSWWRGGRLVAVGQLVARWAAWAKARTASIVSASLAGLSSR
jgi:hypothetical protein